MSEWSGPNAQQYPSNEPDGVKRLIGVVQDVAQKSRDATKNLLRTAGIFIADTGMRIESALTVNGNLTAAGNTDIDGALNVDANATFGGTMTVTGDATFSGNLAVPNGSITNDALANPVTGRSGNASQTSVTFTTTLTAYATVTIGIPAGFSRAEVIGVSSLFTGSSTPNAAAMRTRINGVDGEQMTVTTDANFANGASSYARSLTGLAGGNLTIQTMIQQAAGATMSGGCTTSALVTFYR